MMYSESFCNENKSTNRVLRAMCFCVIYMSTMLHSLSERGFGLMPALTRVVHCYRFESRSAWEYTLPLSNTGYEFFGRLYALLLYILWISQSDSASLVWEKST